MGRRGWDGVATGLMWFVQLWYYWNHTHHLHCYWTAIALTTSHPHHLHCYWAAIALTTSHPHHLHSTPAGLPTTLTLLSTVLYTHNYTYDSRNNCLMSQGVKHVHWWPGKHSLTWEIAVQNIALVTNFANSEISYIVREARSVSRRRFSLPPMFICWYFCTKSDS